MAKVFIVIFSCLLLIACQQPEDEYVNPFPDKIRNSKHPTHVNIPGTRMFLVVPKAFKISQKFKGIAKGEAATIEVIDANGASYYSTAELFSQAKIEQRGYPVLEFKEVKINGFEGKSALLRGQGSIRYHTVIFGDSTFSATIHASFNSKDGGTEGQVRRALVSVYYDTTMEVSLYAPAIFTLDDSKSIFKKAKSEAGKNIYSLNGLAKSRNPGAPYVFAFNVPMAGLTLEELADKAVPMADHYNIGNIHEGVTNGFPSLTREVFGELAGKEVIIYQHVVLIGETVVCMQGVAGNDEFEKYLEEFEKLTRTVTKK